MSGQRFISVWDAIENAPEEAENVKRRSAFMTALKNHLSRNEITQDQAAKLFDVDPSRIVDLMHGKINRFNLDALERMAAIAGLQPE